jgi:hypothetical protein
MTFCIGLMTFSTIGVLAGRSDDVMTESRRANVQSSAQILAERLGGGVRQFRVLF